MASSHKPSAAGAPPRPPEVIEEALRPQDLVMTLLGTYMRGNHRTVWSGGLVQLLSELGFSTGAARVALTRLADRDLIDRIRQGRLIYYRLTVRAERVLAEGDRRIFTLGNPAPTNSWTMVWHEIPESKRPERGQLARRLRFLGFGSLQDGLWVSPHDQKAELTPLLDELAVADRTVVLVGRLAEAASAETILRRAWDLDALCQRYDAFAAEFGGYKKPRRSLEEREAFLVRTRLIHLYRAFPTLDPGLPDRLMPNPRARPRAVKVFEAAYEALAEPAQRHFDRCATNPR